MLSYLTAFQTLKKELNKLYDEGEAIAIAHEVMEHLTGYNKLQRLSEKEKLFNEQQQRQFDEALARLMKGEPLQYITGVQWFLGRPFQVNKEVLIPRPETEELVTWIAHDWKERTNISILDIGTGSGCIPVSLKLLLHAANVTSCDVSSGALQTAKKNATDLQVEVSFLQLDFLNQSNWQPLDHFDIIVSNPPYIPISEQESLGKNVREFEPATALFVPDGDPLIFYRCIALFGKSHLRDGGAIYCELHQDYAEKTKQLFQQMGYANTILQKDMHGNMRMLKAS
jgi:release factor glutamine methyltransferase